MKEGLGSGSLAWGSFESGIDDECDVRIARFRANEAQPQERIAQILKPDTHSSWRMSGKKRARSRGGTMKGAHPGWLRVA